MQYCVTCEKNVSPTKKFSFGWFMLNCLWVIGSGVYILYWIFLKTKTCPICNGSQLEAEREFIDHENDTPIQLALSKPKQLANSSEQSANDAHEKKVRKRQNLLQQNLKSAEHRKKSKRDVQNSRLSLKHQQNREG